MEGRVEGSKKKRLRGLRMYGRVKGFLEGMVEGS